MIQTWGIQKASLALLVVVGTACGDSGLEGVPPGWEQATQLEIRSEECQVTFGVKPTASYVKEGGHARLNLKDISMLCSEKIAAAMKTGSSAKQEILIYRVRPLEANQETCGCKFDAEISVGLAAGIHMIDVYTWGRWGDEPDLKISIEVTM